MELEGNALIERLKQDEVVIKTYTAADQSTINLDDLFTFVTVTLEQEQLVSAEIVISGDEPIHLRLESNLINLPLRYVNNISKIVINDPAKEVNLYMIVESPFVSHSKLRIDYAATVSAYLDDFDSVAAKIANYFDEKLALINENEATAKTEAENESTETEQQNDEDA
ncbi:hypothetical protein LIX87_02845 [Weissella viridescens]|uniref:hypothetical protein n=1 Tax=Weissella viridescens TaxID=1629 RepID=UPI001D078EA3|nr:hypothetical protein [Weissella viridescens]MCB6840077.1 hypothetical protein [Weissella viridescens]MCB6846689.1 hypothetical protein [Weissella viridescens]